jgi:hypothetical protein
MLSITLNDKGKAKVTGVMALPKGTQVPQQFNPSIYFSLDEFNLSVFEGLSEGIKKMIVMSPEYQSAIKRDSIDNMPSDDIDDPNLPF